MAKQMAIVVSVGIVGLSVPAVALTQSVSAAVPTGFNRIEAESYAASTGSIIRQPSGDAQSPTNPGLSLLRRTNTLTYTNVQFGTSSANSVDIRLSSAVNSGGGKVLVRSGSASGTVVASLVVPKTGSWQSFKTVRLPLSRQLSGTQKITLTFSSANANPFLNLNWFQFSGTNPTPPVQPTPPASPSPTPPASPSPTPPASALPTATATSASPTPTTTGSPTPTPSETQTSDPGPATRDGFSRVESEQYDDSSGNVLKQPSGDQQEPHNPGLSLLTRNNVLTYRGVGFGDAHATSVDLRLASAVNNAGGTVKIRTGSASGPVIGSLVVPRTGTWQNFQTVRVPLGAELSGTQTIVVTFSSSDGDPFVNMNWFQFTGTGVPSASPTPTSEPSPTSDPSATAEPSPSPSASVTPTPSASVTPTQTPTATPSASTSPTPTVPSLSPTPTTSPTPINSEGFVVRLVNDTGQPDSNVFVTADTGGVGSASYTGSVGNRFQPGLGRGVPLTDLNGPGTDPASHTYSFVINGYSGGRIYYSIGRGFTAHWPAAHDESIPFDIVELNVNGAGRGDFYGDLSAMEQIGIPANLQVLDADGRVIQTGDGPADRNIACYQDVYDDLASNAPAGWDVNSVKMFQPNGDLLRLVGPNADASRYPSLREYVESLHGQTLRIRGRFGGTGTLAGAYYDYSSYVDSEGNLYLRGTLTDPNDPTKPNASYPHASSMFVAADDLWSNATRGYTGYGIYLQNGPFTLDGTVTGDGHTTPYSLVAGTGNTQAIHNDVYGWIYGDLVTAYAYGYWGGKYGNDSSHFDGKAPFNAARNSAEPFAAWNIWEQAIWNTSDSYGMALGERFGSGGKKSPLIGVGSGAAGMQVTLKGGCSTLR